MEHQHSLEADGRHNIFFVERHSSFCLSDLPPVCFLSMQDSVIFITESSLVQTTILGKVQFDIIFFKRTITIMLKQESNERTYFVALKEVTKLSSTMLAHPH